MVYSVTGLVENEYCSRYFFVCKKKTYICSSKVKQGESKYK